MKMLGMTLVALMGMRMETLLAVHSLKRCEKSANEIQLCDMQKSVHKIYVLKQLGLNDHLQKYSYLVSWCIRR